MTEYWWIIPVGLFLWWLFWPKGTRRVQQTEKSLDTPTPSTSTHAAKVKPKRRVATAYVSGIPSDFEMTPEFSHTLKLMEDSRDHIFITGKAGTGKSTLLQYFRDTTKKKVIVVAPTGVAAINVGGSTIHSLFRLPPRLVTTKDVKVVPSRRELFARLDTVIVDEVSMVRADLMDAIDSSLRLNRRETNQPFGGVQTILIGDLYQLPPVVESDLSEYFYDSFGSPFFFSASVWRQAQLRKIELQRVFRQTDQDFISLLNKVRDNRLTPTDLDRLNQRYAALGSSQNNDMAITLTSTNAIASEINQSRLDSLPDPEYCFDAVVTGQFDERSFPTERRLRLKRGAHIMMVKNDPNKQWVNGSLGVIEDISQHSIKVSFGDFSSVVEPVTWEKIDYEYNAEEGKIEPVVVGAFRQYPIKLAWAITIHKSQGKTFDKVIIDMGNGAFAHGQAYVALSRCRSFQGIELRTPIKWSDIILDDRVVDFLSQQ